MRLVPRSSIKTSENAAAGRGTPVERAGHSQVLPGVDEEQ